MNEIITVPDSEIVDFHLRNPHESGWHFGAGNPEFWQFSDIMLKPGGRLLDIGIGDGRSSLYFALNGMDVVGVDNNPDQVTITNEMATDLSQTLPVKLEAVLLDVINQPLPEGQFDTILIDHLVHLGSKQIAFDLFDKALASLEPGGHIWVRGAGKESYAYEELIYANSWQPVRFIDADVVEHPCTCSGEYRIEPTLFFDPLDLSAFFDSRACRLVHAQTISTEEKMNIMYGEDYNRDQVIPWGGMITVLAQKR